MTIRLELSNLEGHDIHDLRTEFAQKKRSTSRHCDEEYKPSNSSCLGMSLLLPKKYSFHCIDHLM